MRGIVFTIALFAALAPNPGRAQEGREYTDRLLATDILTGVIPITALGIAHFKEDKEGRRQLFWSTVASTAVTGALRLAFNETSWGERPNGHPYGFPSGHMAFLVPSPAFLWDRYDWRYGLPAYLGTAYVAYVRVDEHRHRWRDIIAATAISIGLSKWIVSPYEEDRAQLMPVVGPDYAGLDLRYVW